MAPPAGWRSTQLHRYTPAVVAALLFLAFYSYARSHSYRDPGSIFFDASRAYARRYSQFRLEEVSRETLVKQPDHNASVCVIFTTWKRPIETTIRSAVAGLTPEERADIHLTVFFAHADPTLHPSWGIDVDEAVSYKTIAGSRFDQVVRYEKENDYLHKGIEDYAMALQHCLSTNLPWTAVFEDDVLFADGWYAHLKDALLQPDPTQNTLLYYRMFNDERATGWYKRGLLANNELAISAGVNAVLFVLLRKRPWSQLIPLFLLVTGLLTIFFASGKASMLPPRPGVRTENFGCCSQALIYPRRVLKPLISYLRNEGQGQVDLQVDLFGRMNGLHRKSIYPMMVQHNGAYTGSVRGTTKEDAKQIWSMAFENLDPVALKDEHARLVDKLWPHAT